MWLYTTMSPAPRVTNPPSKCHGERKSKPISPGGLQVQGGLGCQVVLGGPAEKEHSLGYKRAWSSLLVTLSSERGEGWGPVKGGSAALLEILHFFNKK